VSKFFNAVSEVLSEAKPKAKERVKLKAYHGSPHSFDRFSTDSIGTGEGAQAYGQGLYFAEREGTAQSYRNALSKGLVKNDGSEFKIDRRNSNELMAEDVLIKSGGDYDAAVENLRQKNEAGLGDLYGAETLGILNRFREAGASPKGNMYEVNIDASPDELIDFDAPLSEQKTLLNKLDEKYGDHEIVLQQLGVDLRDNPSGVNLIDALGMRRGNQKDTPQIFKDIGIKGIQYTDAQTRFSPGQKTKNYVIFDDSLIDIARKYGISADVLSNTAIYGGTAALIGMGLSPSEAQASVKEANNPANIPLADRLTQKVDGQIQTIAPIEESYRGAATRNLAEALGGEREDYTRAKKLMSAGDFLPGIGDAQAGVDAVDAANRGDYLEAGVNSLALLPFVGGMASKKGRELLNYFKLPEVDRDTPLLQRVGDVDSVNNMNVEYEAGPQTLNLPMLRAEQLLNRPYVSTMADTTRGQGETVTKVDDVEVDATMHGGQDHMVRPGNMQEGSLWASADGAVSGIMNAARQASDLPGAEGKPLFMGYGMAGTSPMFATFTGDVALPVAQARMSPAAKKALDKRIREGSGKVTGVKDWPGIDSPNAYEFMLGAGGKRKKVLDALDEFRGEGALNSSQVRTIVTDPRQLNPQVGALMNVGEIDLNRTPFSSLHPTYNTSVPGTPLGQFGSGFNVLEAKPYNRSGQVFTEEMQTRGHDLSADKLPSQVGKAMQGGLIGVLDEDVINDLITRGIVKP